MKKQRAAPSLRRAWNIFRTLTAILCLAFCAGIALYVVATHDLLLPRLGEPKSWQGITPGLSTLQDAIDILETDLSPELRDREYYAYILESPAHSCWDRVEFWAHADDLERTIVAIFLDGATHRCHEIGSEVPRVPLELVPLVRTHGHPSTVLFAGPFGRVVAWAREGLLVGVNADVARVGYDQRNLEVEYLLLYEPSGPKRFERSVFGWPWPDGFRVANARYDYQSDGLPRDPFDWELLAR